MEGDRNLEEIVLAETENKLFLAKGQLMLKQRTRLGDATITVGDLLKGQTRSRGMQLMRTMTMTMLMTMMCMRMM